MGIINTAEGIRGYKIPCFDGYVLTDDFRVYSMKSNGFLAAARMYRSKQVYCQLSLRNIGVYTVSLPRIACAVKHDVDFRKIDRYFLIVFKDGKAGFDNISVSDRTEHAAKIRLIKSPVDDLYYERSHKFSSLVPENNVAGLYVFMDRYKKTVLCILHKYLSRDCERVYSELVNDLITGVLERKYRCAEPVSYPAKIIRRRYNRCK